MSSSDIAHNIAQFGSFRSRAATHAGTAGRNDEDAYLNRPDLGLWAVATARATTSRAKLHRPRSLTCCKASSPDSPPPTCSRKYARLETAHERLRAAASRHGAGAIMTTTPSSCWRATTILPVSGWEIHLPTCCVAIR